MALAMVTPWLHPRTRVYYLCRRVPDDLKVALCCWPARRRSPVLHRGPRSRSGTGAVAPRSGRPGPRRAPALDHVRVEIEEGFLILRAPAAEGLGEALGRGDRAAAAERRRDGRWPRPPCRSAHWFGSMRACAERSFRRSSTSRNRAERASQHLTGRYPITPRTSLNREVFGGAPLRSGEVDPVTMPDPSPLRT